jgi:hypothetical protein
MDDPIVLLRRQALAKRNTAILAAKREYHAALREIASLNRKLGVKKRGRPPKATSENATLKATTVARAILLEGKAI